MKSMPGYAQSGPPGPYQPDPAPPSAAMSAQPTRARHSNACHPSAQPSQPPGSVRPPPSCPAWSGGVQPSSAHASTATPAQAMPWHGLLEMGWAGAGPSDELRTGMELLARTAWAGLGMACGGLTRSELGRTGLGWDWVGPVWVRWTG